MNVVIVVVVVVVVVVNQKVSKASVIYIAQKSQKRIRGHSGLARGAG